MKLSRYHPGVVLLGLVILSACEGLTDLDVPNNNDPDRDDVLNEAEEIEALIATSFLLTYNAEYDYNSAMAYLSCAAEEGTLSWGGSSLRTLSAEPRYALPNDPSWRYAHVMRNPWYDHYEALSALFDGLAKIANDTDGRICSQIDCDRAVAFGKFVQGIAHGYLALLFDSAFVIDETVDLQNDEVPLLPYYEVMEAALGYLDAAVAATTGGVWVLEDEWINGSPLTASEVAQLANSFYARLLTQVARTPAERATLAGLGTWDDVISRVDLGITNDVTVNGDAETLWFNDYVWMFAQSGSTTWGRADYKTIGWTEISEGTGTAYAEWLAAPLSDRTDFRLNVPDERVMPPGDPEGWGLDFMFRGPSFFRSHHGSYHYSMYVHHRYDDYPHGGYTAPTPLMVTEAQQLMKAEALLRTGEDRQSIVGIINSTRVTRGNLPPATIGEPDSDLMDKLIYEYRIENMNVCPGCAYFTRRGWGELAPTGPYHHQGLVEGTALHLPIPGEELIKLQKPIYDYGGVGNEGSALSGGAIPRSSADRPRGTAVPATAVYALGDFDSLSEKLKFLRRHTGQRRPGVASLTRHRD